MVRASLIRPDTAVWKISKHLKNIGRQKRFIMK
jgi:hypothetical protein